MKVLVVQGFKERKNRIPDLSDPGEEGKWRRAFTVEEAISTIREYSPGLVILDVEIENGTGFKVFEHTTDVTYDKIVLTESAGHVFKSIRYNVLEYLIKPLKADEIQDAILSVMFKQRKYGIQQLFNDRLQNPGFARPSHVFVASRNKVRLIDVEQLMMIEDLGNIRMLFLADGQEIETLASSRKLRKLLSGHGFDSPEQGLALHARHVVEIRADGDYTWAVLRNGRIISISYQMERRIRFRWKRSNIRPPYLDYSA